jgi:hypothetical protein
VHLGVDSDAAFEFGQNFFKVSELGSPIFQQATSTAYSIVFAANFEQSGHLDFSEVGFAHSSSELKSSFSRPSWSTLSYGLYLESVYFQLVTKISSMRNSSRFCVSSRKS